MIRRHKTTIFTDAKESTTVYELKRIVEGILKRPPEDQKLYKDDVMLNDGQTLGNCGFTNQTARPQAPATVGLAFRLSDDSYEQLRVESFSTPPELPDVMKPQDSGSTANEQAVQWGRGQGNERRSEGGCTGGGRAWILWWCRRGWVLPCRRQIFNWAQTIMNMDSPCCKCQGGCFKVVHLSWNRWTHAR